MKELNYTRLTFQDRVIIEILLRKKRNEMKNKKILKACKNGHKFYKSSSCPTCPICEEERKPNNNFLSLLAAPARRALENSGITTLKQFSEYTEKEILKLHGMGKSSIPKLQKILSDNNLTFKK